MKSLATALLIFATCIGVAETVALIDRADATLVATDQTRHDAATAVTVSAATPRLAEFAKSVQQRFSLAQPSYPVAFADVHPGDANYVYAQAIYPYLHRQLLCPECSLSLNFSPNSALTRAQSAMVLVSILTAKDKISLLTPMEARDVLANVADADSVPEVARPYIATAIKNGILRLEPGNLIRPMQPALRADLTATLDAMQGQMLLPPPRAMRASLHAAIRRVTH